MDIINITEHVLLWELADPDQFLLVSRDAEIKKYLLGVTVWD